jgi:hypothetical protein
MLEATKVRIKNFLNQQGFLKAQTNPTGDDDDDAILALDPSQITLQSSQSPSPTLSVSSEEPHTTLEISSVRDEFQPAPLYVADYTNRTSYSPLRSPEDPDVPLASLNVDHTHLDATLISPASALTTDHSFSTFHGSVSDGFHAYHGNDPYPVQSSRYPALQSSYGTLYSYDSHVEDFPASAVVEEYNHPSGSMEVVPQHQQHDAAYNCGPLAIPFCDLSPFFQNPWQQPWVKHYLHNVVQREYLLADGSVSQLIWTSLQESETAREGACLLATLHQQSLGGAQQPRAKLLTMLNHKASAILSAQGCKDDGDAFAALQIVSCFLFLGGRGQWARYLDLAIDWVDRIFAFSNADMTETLRRQSDWARFLIKTTMWFDVLSSVTKRTAPSLLSKYRELHHGALIDEEGSPASMLPIMGCESAIVLALAETSALARYKDTEISLGRLSMPRLVASGQRIEQLYLQNSHYPLEVHNPAESDSEKCRRLTSAVFRASARIYLHTVLSGDSPGCPEIMAAVNDTVACLRRVPEEDKLAERAVVRMVVFSICIAGCLTNYQPHREYLLGRLASQQVEAVGNCDEVRKVMMRVWELRQAGSNMSWRDVVAQASPEGCLLLV